MSRRDDPPTFKTLTGCQVLEISKDRETGRPKGALVRQSGVYGGERVDRETWLPISQIRPGAVADMASKAPLLLTAKTDGTTIEIDLPEWLFEQLDWKQAGHYERRRRG